MQVVLSIDERLGRQGSDRLSMGVGGRGRRTWCGSDGVGVLWYGAALRARYDVQATLNDITRQRRAITAGARTSIPCLLPRRANRESRRVRSHSLLRVLFRPEDALHNCSSRGASCSTQAASVRALLIESQPARSLACGGAVAGGSRITPAR
jgi:hypothetical protein